MTNPLAKLVHWSVAFAAQFILATIAAAAKPNVIVIITDDQGYGDVSAHGSPVLKTPQLDKIRSESVRFTDFHVAPDVLPDPRPAHDRDSMQCAMVATAVCQGRSMMRGGAAHHGRISSPAPATPPGTSESGTSATATRTALRTGASRKPIHHRAWGITSLADSLGESHGCLLRSRPFTQRRRTRSSRDTAPTSSSPKR